MKTSCWRNWILKLETDFSRWNLNMRKAVIGKNKFCGPMVLSALTGKNTDECSRLGSIDGNKSLKIMFTSDMSRALHRLNIAYKESAYYREGKKEPTLKHWFNQELSLSERSMYHVVLVTDHYVLIHEDKHAGPMVLCSRVRGLWVPLSKHSAARQHVKCIWTIKEWPNDF